ncbi:amyloid protein-binding protein 2 isoform X2 [Adelges cooleyi]|uniref:amyloid protein-binding protein 2 isoform X2 n=1 Tax=Adelges cooleyi TaxID=133065 RepID=UPI00217FE1F2|nr:amyloid protein-binding protein 2 isoform X2 [Adelges cooleyi]
MNQLCSNSLFDLSLHKLCASMNEDDLHNVLNSCSPYITLQVVWKVLGVKDDFDLNGLVSYRSPNENLVTVHRGRALVQPTNPYPPRTLFPPRVTVLNRNDIRHKQTKFKDKLNFCNHFDLNLFFKLLKDTAHRCRLYTIFQICIQKKGFEFPMKFAMQWISDNVEQESANCLHHIDQGLQLGIFLGDSGWFKESALVLSCTYELISKNWDCSSQTLVLTKTLQCLTKWLLVTSNFYDLDEAKEVLQHILIMIDIVENSDKKKLCIAYSYVAVSQYYYQLMEFGEAWLWAVKAVYGLTERSSEVLKLQVISHAIRVCSAANKLNTAKELIQEVHKIDGYIEQYICVDMLLNEACYTLRADLAKTSIDSYYMALDCRRNLFGYFNLQTATVFVDYAYARYVCDYETCDFEEAMCCVLQGIYIMEVIGLPDDHMLVVNAGRVKALILEEKALSIIDLDNDISRRVKQDMLNEAETLHNNALNTSLRAVGESNLLTAKHYCNLGRLYQTKEDYNLSEEMHKRAIAIKESILGRDNPEVALSLGHLASLYTYQLENYLEAEHLYLRSKAIYETSFGNQYTGILYDLQGLARVYEKRYNLPRYSQCLTSIRQFHANREAWLERLASSEVSTVSDRSTSCNMDAIKSILDDGFL